ncbi:unnamed protein product (macronuclear) [Paramecium tetraurelia]|uniref:Uncharacterized protein n=1 Tax=Paramecium tetraurelia TaxID=5888 RepID=A0CVR7_PARTE|nr:uncharacterized protein GSPATT00039045001 [Paramecium tetraurelia]CAK74884.1 unnamed protein product [Paramecium tetraurelia]|eukprot:XP_001442281.1 hypothetical protein (macronuclear) [Paramecium tetraurelia strain d4-2]
MHQLNANYVNSYAKREKAKRFIMTKIKRSCSIDLISILYSLPSKTANTPSFRENLNSRKRSLSNLVSKHFQDSNRLQEFNMTQMDGPIQTNDKQQKQLNDSSSKSMPSQNQSNTNRQQDDLNNNYEYRKGDVNFRQFHKNFYQDVLQLEALYYQLSQLGFQRSAPLQLPPILSYFLYSLIMHRADQQKLSRQFLDIYEDDEYYSKLRMFYSEYFKQASLDTSMLFYKVSFYSNPQDYMAFENILFKYITNMIPYLKLDYKMLLDDFLLYFSLSGLQQKSIECYVTDDSFFRKNNIAIGNIRFVFKQKDGLLLDFKQPIGKFENKQFLDYSQFQAEFAQQLSSVEPIKLFNSYLSEPHSERTIILLILADIYLNKSIFKNLNFDLIDSKQKNNIISLSQIYLEIQINSNQ